MSVSEEQEGEELDRGVAGELAKKKKERKKYQNEVRKA